MTDAPLRIACCQLAPSVDDRDGNRERSRAAVAHAVAEGAQVVVLPELVTSGYAFRSASEAATRAETVDGPSLRGWCDATRELDVTIVGGFCEWRGDDAPPYNSAAVVSRGAVLAVYRKLHLWSAEQDCFAPGAAAAPVVETPHGRIGLGICYDIEFPEMGRGLALRGAELLAFPTNWPRTYPPDGEQTMLRTLAMATARLSRVFVAVCDRGGTDRELAFEGGSLVVGPDGWPVAEATGPEEETLIADCELAQARDKRLGSRNDVFGDRRAAFYG